MNEMQNAIKRFSGLFCTVNGYLNIIQLEKTGGPEAHIGIISGVCKQGNNDGTRWTYKNKK